MIRIESSLNCCGCSACASICPKQCITMQPDEEGFLYPEVDVVSCIDCGKCESVCPILSVNEPQQPTHVYCSKNKDEAIRKHSSSGGVFTAIAEVVIREGGVVFGAKFDTSWKVIHSYTETVEGLKDFRGSKYVQSEIGESFEQTEIFLKQKRKVLFSGTPCQIAGLRKYLRRNYDNLICIDVVCHGVPSPLVWNKYVETLCSKNKIGNKSVSYLKEIPKITGISFRDKRAGWRKYAFSAWSSRIKGNTLSLLKNKKRIKYEILQQNVFMRGFLQHLYLRPSCHHCCFRNFRSGSDLTMADFWGIERMYPKFSDDKGVSLLIQKNEGVSSLLNNCSIEKIEVPVSDYLDAFSGNGALYNDSLPSKNRIAFWNEFKTNSIRIDRLIEENTSFLIKDEIKSKVIILLLNLHLYDFANCIVKKIKGHR